MWKLGERISAQVIDRDAIDFSSNFQKYPYGHRVGKFSRRKGCQLGYPANFRQVVHEQVLSNEYKQLYNCTRGEVRELKEDKKAVIENKLSVTERSSQGGCNSKRDKRYLGSERIAGKQEIKGYFKQPSSHKSSREVGGRGREVGGPDHTQGVLPQNWGDTELNRSVTCRVLKATANDRRHLTLCHDEFRGP
ncbi:uncharacterized protein TNCV_1736241 [Trichonephila clavipes]|nr:uncharacterized protein TNCV_1736241 [Trichonephila clavipes]